MTDATVDSVLAELAALEDPKARAVNERHGDDHGVNLTKLRAVAKAAGTSPQLSRELWATGDTAARLVALLIVKPKEFSSDDLDRMMREANGPKVSDWLVNYIVKKSPLAEEMRLRWFDDADPDVAASAWALTTTRVMKDRDGLDLDALLDQIEREMKDAPERLQWAMNETLANIGIYDPSRRERALEIGERLQVLADYPTAPGCTSPFAPSWIAEIVRRREG
ncbi:MULTISPECIES: DNA alkylation repair protein [unclassified Microbacterium]|uniref:DNA alkylation repair protein n=1 Tax=unclassified Microbacterium TaxID=2609290 RepID=UPI0012F923C1|nr:DNA alkylation repair protein [Microbacterium sp. MAH-37]MVQ41498.1 DNA alkylation repair protein [Microbacterium sp. MAH-37]